MKIHWEVCKGCRSYNNSPSTKRNALRYGHFCLADTTPEKEGSECPCRTCLVKMICVKPCEQFSTYRRNNGNTM